MNEVEPKNGAHVTVDTRMPMIGVGRAAMTGWVVCDLAVASCPLEGAIGCLCQSSRT